MSSLANLALNGTASQSSMMRPAPRAIDGNPSASWGDNSCASTLSEMSPWWKLDLIEPVDVYMVRLTTRSTGQSIVWGCICKFWLTHA